MRLAILTTLVLGAAVPAQMFWTRLSPPTSPAPGDNYEMVATANPPGLLLFGGVPLPSTWRFTGGQWTQLTPAREPSARSGHAMAYDSARDRVVLFGGWMSPGLSNETWEWDGANWNLLTPAMSPPARWHAAMAYDPTSGHMVLHGGRIAGRYAGDTWIWDGANWSPSSSVYGPSPRSHAAMASHSELSMILLFGGTDPFGQLDDTWYFRDGMWNRWPRPERPSARLGHSLTYDLPRQRFVLHGGSDLGMTFYQDTWEFSTTTGWVETTPQQASTPQVAEHAAAYDVQAGGVMIFGGARFTFTGGGGGYRQVLAETHLYTPTVRASTRRIGNGCGGIVDLAILSRPQLGEPAFGFRTIPLAANPFTVSVAGLSLQSSNPPIPLGPCNLHLGAPILTMTPLPLGTTYLLAIPRNPALRGLRFFVQVFETERSPGSGWAGLGFSPAYEIIIGD